MRDIVGGSTVACIGGVALCVASACAPVYGRATSPVPRAGSESRAGTGADDSGVLAAILGNLVWPLALDGAEILSSRYGPRSHPRSGNGRFHSGLDIRAPRGTPIYAVAAGQVVRSARGGAYGNLVVIDHGDEFESLYAHNSRNLVSEGDTVRRGQVVATVGNTGNATGDHLHFELRWRGGTIDPRTVLPALEGARGR